MHRVALSQRCSVLFAFNEGKAVITKFIVAVALFLAVAHAGLAQVCSHPRDPSFYEANNYTVGKITFYSPFGFFFLVRQRYDILRASLPIAEGDRFSKEAYDRSFNQVDIAVREDSVFGKNAPVKIVVTTGGTRELSRTGQCPQDNRHRIPHFLDRSASCYTRHSGDPSRRDRKGRNYDSGAEYNP